MQDNVRGTVLRTDHLEEDVFAVPQAITGKKTGSKSDHHQEEYVDEQSWIAPQKPNRRTPRSRFSGERGFRRHLLSRYSVRAELWDGEVRKLLICGSLGSGCQKDSGRTFSGLTEESDIWVQRESQRGSEES